MRKRVSLFFAAAGMLGVVAAASTAPALAWNPFGNACTGGNGHESGSAGCQAKNTNPLTGSNGALTKVSDVLAFVAGMIAVIFIIIGGIKYITSAGDSANITSAKNTIIYASIGLVVVVLARAIISFVVNRL